ncbi:hypothetical protein EB796_012998 [Bugula neritina]|uniref:Glycine N-methyltransferase n=1 Tax=Bugula neritina TaxID=10212 RepID=A0A7J7JRR6_BUGNE|nr:hypothetical protein EB796_012998 [Bugula neritina]
MEKVREPAAIAQDVLLGSLTKICQEQNDVEISMQFECNRKFSSVEQRLDQRSPIIKKFLLDLAKKYETPGRGVLDVACGPGNDSIYLVHGGFKVFSCDLSDGMVEEMRTCKQEFINNGCKEFENWSIFKANMIEIDAVIDSNKNLPPQYDTIVCLEAIMFLMGDQELKKLFSCFEKLLRPGGVIVVDHRNFEVMAKTGKPVNGGINPFTAVEYRHIAGVAPFAIYGPAPEQKPIAVFLAYERPDGSNLYTTSRVFTREQITSLAKSTFGENCKIQILHDLKDESECPPEGTAIITYVIEKPLE